MAGKDSKIPYVTESSWDVLAISGQVWTLSRSRFGGAEGNRTPDLRIANATLSHLSYGPAPARGGEMRGPGKLGGLYGFHPPRARPISRVPRFGQVLPPSLLTSGARAPTSREARRFRHPASRRL